MIPLTRRSGSPSLSKSPTASTLAVTFCSRPKNAPTKPYRPSLRNQLAWLLIDPGRMSKSPSPSTSAQNARDPSKKRAGSGTSEKVGGLPPLLRSKRTEPPSSSKSRLPSPSKSAGTAPVIPTPPGSSIPGTSTPDPRFVQICVGDTTRSNNPSPLKSPQAGWKSCTGGSCELARANSGSTTFRMKLTPFVSCLSSAWTVMAVEPAVPWEPRVIWRTRFERPNPGTIRRAELLTIPCRELHARRLIREPDSTSNAENGT